MKKLHLTFFVGALLRLSGAGCTSFQNESLLAKINPPVAAPPLVIAKRPVPTKRPKPPGYIAPDRSTNMRPPFASELLPSRARSVQSVSADPAFPLTKWFEQGPTTNADANLNEPRSVQKAISYQ